MYTLRIWKEAYYVNKMPYIATLYDDNANAVALFKELNIALDSAYQMGWEINWEKG